MTNLLHCLGAIALRTVSDVTGLLLFSALLPSMLSVQVMEQPAASVPPGAQRVEMLTLVLSAACSGDVPLHGVTVTHRGMGAIRDIASVSAVIGGQRISRGRALSSADGAVTLTFRPAPVVPACGSLTLSVVADVSAAAAVGAEHRMTIGGPADIDAGGAGVTITQFSAAPVRRTVGISQGSVSAAFLPLLSRITYGDRRVVARLRLEAEGYDQLMEAVTLTNDGSARGADLQNLTLETSRGQILARLPALDGERAPFVLPSPLLMERGQIFLLTVRADVRASRRRTIAFTLEEPGDLAARRATGRR